MVSRPDLSSKHSSGKTTDLAYNGDGMPASCGIASVAQSRCNENRPMDDRTRRRMLKETRQLTPAVRMERFYRLQEELRRNMSADGRERFERRNRRKRRIKRDNDPPDQSL